MFNETIYSASEAGPLEVDVCVRIGDLTGELQSNLIVTLNDIPGTAGKMILKFNPLYVNSCLESFISLSYIILSGEGEDFSGTPPGEYEAIFSSGSEIGSTACDTITIVDDDVLEGPHNFGFSIIGASVGGTSLPGVAMSQFATVQVEDNESMQHSSSLLMTMMLDDLFVYTFLSIHVK